MPDELRFTDPAFRCEVNLSGTAQALYEAARPQFERLKGIRSLGLLAHIHDIAIHTRHQHLVGMMRIFNKLSQQPEGKGPPKSFLWSFWCRLCFAQTGHAALSYDSEKAVLLACHLDVELKTALRTLLQPVIDDLAACPECKNACSVRKKGKDEAHEWFETLVEQNRWRQLHRWIAALKLLQESNLFGIFGALKPQQKNSPAFSKPEALKLLVAPDCTWDTAMNNLVRLDYIVRDLAYAGTLGLQMDVDNLVARADKDHPDWQLLLSLESYLTETLYESIPTQTASALFQRALADILIERRITLEQLFGINPNSTLDDDGLIEIVKKRANGREVFDSRLRNAWRTWSVTTYVDPRQSPSEIEKSITGQKKGHLSGHVSKRMTCFKHWHDHSIALSVSYVDSVTRPHVTDLLKLFRSFLQRQYPMLDTEEFCTALFEAVLDSGFKHNLDSIVKLVAALPIELDVLRKAANVINNRNSKDSHSPIGFNIRIGTEEYPLSGNGAGLRVNVMHAALMGDKKVRENLEIEVAQAAEILWTELLTCQSIYFKSQPTKSVLDLVDTAQTSLVQNIVNSKAGAARDLESYAFLEALKHPGNGVSFRLTLPNMIILNDKKTHENEYDSISIVLRDNQAVEIWIWAVTTEDKYQKKVEADLGKIQKLRDRLGRRWGGEIRVAPCLVYLDGNNICRDIDGRQSFVALPAKTRRNT